ncbi:MAG: hypothetical protein ACYDG3_10295, partial [Bacillati bacterium]
MAKAQSRIATTDLEIKAAIASGKVYAQHPYRPRAVAAEYRATDDMLAIKLATGIELLMPRKLLQGLEDADPQEVANV